MANSVVFKRIQEFGCRPQHSPTQWNGLKDSFFALSPACFLFLTSFLLWVLSVWLHLDAEFLSLQIVHCCLPWNGVCSRWYKSPL